MPALMSFVCCCCFGQFWTARLDGKWAADSRCRENPHRAPSAVTTLTTQQAALVVTQRHQNVPNFPQRAGGVMGRWRGKHAAWPNSVLTIANKCQLIN
ncbi:hypothetical protein B0T26DRAFT_444750 [Lasiosphaeria miniovina]|uniref:Secreted protein n=1 Tax=Lasiosphaeria miniovina TaxID=1954250 RepID=A0AA40DM11_9PEZI|nr:uncharacterized protein B0T26DRAFT_444750 [Lasiosphaeria miniovina]KAK0706176.1 hypothetical protein B0T26DRAFT_444750 [Lasiosphaeria miniovina]